MECGTRAIDARMAQSYNQVSGRVHAQPHRPQSLPPRSTAGQLTLDQHIGVRIPGGQPKHSKQLNPRTKQSPDFSSVGENVWSLSNFAFCSPLAAYSGSGSV